LNSSFGRALPDMPDMPLFLRVNGVYILLLLILNIVVNMAYLVISNRGNKLAVYISGIDMADVV
jgi:hypothetical protein